MKLLILITLISTNLFAQELSLMEQKELTRRLELYGLTTPKEPILIKGGNYNTEIISKLDRNIKENYIPNIITRLGHCEDGDCLRENNGKYHSLLTGSGEVCLPQTRCEFYQCMEKKYQCETVGTDYFTKLAFPTCSKYLDNIEKRYFTQNGYDWIYSVMVCLQKGLIDECELNKNCKKRSKKKTCEYITKFTLEFHPGCYLNSGVGVCKLPLQDKINIWRTVAKFLTRDEFKQAVATVKRCIIKEREAY